MKFATFTTNDEPLTFTNKMQLKSLHMLYQERRIQVMARRRRRTWSMVRRRRIQGVARRRSLMETVL